MGTCTDETEPNVEVSVYSTSHQAGTVTRSQTQKGDRYIRRQRPSPPCHSYCLPLDIPGCSGSKDRGPAVSEAYLMK